MANLNKVTINSLPIPYEVEDIDYVTTKENVVFSFLTSISITPFKIILIIVLKWLPRNKFFCRTNFSGNSGFNCNKRKHVTN